MLHQNENLNVLKRNKKQNKCCDFMLLLFNIKEAVIKGYIM